jgi:hypothetical protein
MLLSILVNIDKDLTNMFGLLEFIPWSKDPHLLDLIIESLKYSYFGREFGLPLSTSLNI